MLDPNGNTYRSNSSVWKYSCSGRQYKNKLLKKQLHKNANMIIKWIRFPNLWAQNNLIKVDIPLKSIKQSIKLLKLKHHKLNWFMYFRWINWVRIKTFSRVFKNVVRKKLNFIKNISRIFNPWNSFLRFRNLPLKSFTVYKCPQQT